MAMQEQRIDVLLGCTPICPPDGELAQKGKVREGCAKTCAAERCGLGADVGPS